MKKKKLIIIGVVCLLVLIVILCIVLGNNSDKRAQKKLEDNLILLGRSFYEDYYYPSQEEVQEDIQKFMASFKDNGLSINLENLSKLSSTDKTLLEKMVNPKTKKKCDYENTIITIYPRKNYGKKNYKIEVNLDCGFKDKAKDKKK